MRCWSLSLTVVRLAALALIASFAASCSAAADKQKVNDRIGCDFDANRICQDSMMMPFRSGGWINGSLFDSYYSPNTEPTPEITSFVDLPSGARIDVHCSINMAQRKVVYAYPATSTTLSASDRQWLYQTGRCIGSSTTDAAAKLSGEE